MPHTSIHKKQPRPLKAGADVAVRAEFQYHYINQCRLVKVSRRIKNLNAKSAEESQRTAEVAFYQIL